MPKREIGMDYEPEFLLQEGDELIAKIGGYPVYLNNGELIIGGVNRISLANLYRVEIIYKPCLGSTLEFMKEDFNLGDDTLYQCICLPIIKEDEENPILYYFTFENPFAAAEMFNIIAEYFNKQFQLLKEEEGNKDA